MVFESSSLAPSQRWCSIFKRFSSEDGNVVLCFCYIGPDAGLSVQLRLHYVFIFDCKLKIEIFFVMNNE